MPEVQRQTVIDLSHYYLCEADKSWCSCGAKVFFLFPREGYEEAPMYGLCARCGRIVQTGLEGAIAPEIVG